MKIKELQERYRLKTRQSIYDWIKATNLKLYKDEQGHNYATKEQIEVLDQLEKHLNNGGKLSSFIAVSSVEIYSTVDSVVNSTVDSVIDNKINTVKQIIDSENLTALVGAIKALKRSPLENHGELEKASQRGWILSSSEIKELIGVKPNGIIFYRGNWEFIRTGKIGRENGWIVKNWRN